MLLPLADCTQAKHLVHTDMRHYDDSSHSSGQLVSPRDPSCNKTVTFTVVSGAGQVLATHNGDPGPAVDSMGGTYKAHRGMVRAFIQSAEVRSGSDADRALLQFITTDAGKGGASTIAAGGDAGGVAPIVVQAKAQGLAPVTIVIPVTDDVSFLPLAVASETVAH